MQARVLVIVKSGTNGKEGTVQFLCATSTVRLCYYDYESSDIMV